MAKTLASVLIAALIGLVGIQPAHAASYTLKKKDQFWIVLTAVEPSFEWITTKKEAVGLAKSICREMKRKRDVRDIRTILDISGLSRSQASTMLLTSVEFYCKKKRKWL